MNRRQFVVGSTAAAAGSFLLRGFAATALRSSSVTVVAPAAEPLAGAAPVKWALGKLQAALRGRGAELRVVANLGDASGADPVLLLAGPSASALRDAGIKLPGGPESLAVARARLGGRDVLLVAGSDARGLVYGLTGVAEAIALGQAADEVLRPAGPIMEQPANQVRSVMRMVNSEVEDRASFLDRGYWTRYLDYLATQRFNRFNLAFGLGYDFARNLTDTYFYFAYPFLVSVPGYDVRATNVSAAEREGNLAMLRFISDETAARGMRFQLGIWTHAFQWTNSPRANHVIEGLTPESQAPYSREALAILLKECPNISGVTFRIHGESGVAEGNYDFWKTIFDGCTRAGRVVEIDMHAKGIDESMIKTAAGTGMPITVSPKYWAEHLGLPYHQAAIRPQELPRRERGTGLMALSSGSRSFLRYGYGDLLREDRNYGVIHRVWPGTQRLLLWGDPAFAAGYGRAMSFCGSLGCELMEPLSFKGREGSSADFNGGRDGYADTSLRAPDGDYAKYQLTYRLWGRMLYNPDAKPGVWERELTADFGRAATNAGAALGFGSRVLPLVTTAFAPSASNNAYSPESGMNMAMLDAAQPAPYGETTAPSRFGNASPLDPQLFIKADEYAALSYEGKATARYTPLEVAQWLEDFAAGATRELAQAREKTDPAGAAFRRLDVDVRAEIGLARFYAGKMRAAVLLAWFERSGDRRLLDAAVAAYGQARDGWASTANATKDAYQKDLTFGRGRQQRGQWADRLPDIETDIAALKLAKGPAGAAPGRKTDDLLALAQKRIVRLLIPLAHAPGERFPRGRALEIAAQGSVPAGSAVKLRFRHAHQAEEWQEAPMTGAGGGFRAPIPAGYTETLYPITYYFEVQTPGGEATLSPALGENLNQMPYHVSRPLSKGNC